MIEILKFIFSSFWVWLGTVVLMLTAGVALNSIIVAFRGKMVNLIGASKNIVDKRDD